MDRRARIQKNIDYFVEKYCLIELFHGIWMNYLQFGSCSELHKKSYQYYIYCYSEVCYKKWDQRFPDFLFLTDCFRKQLKLYRPPSLCCDEKELKDYVNFLCEVKQILLVFFLKKDVIFCS